MKISNLQTFLAVIETGSLSRAATRLHVTQSTVTARLQALEDSLGQRLVNRQKSGAVPTAAGLRLRRYAEAMSGLWDQARQEVALPADVRVICNLGCDSDLWTEAGTHLFAVLQEHQPDIAVSIWGGSPAEITGWLESGLVDISLGYAPPATTSQTAIRLADEILVLADGEIVERGTHRELLALDGLYAGMWARQSDGFKSEETGQQEPVIPAAEMMPGEPAQ